MRDDPGELVHPRPRGEGGPAAAGEDGSGPAQAPPAPLDAAEEDPDAARDASLPGHSAGGAGDGEAAVGPPSQDHHPV